MNANKYVLDSSALLAIFKNEPGADKVIPLLEQSVISAVNFSECISKIKLSRTDNVQDTQPIDILKDLMPEVIAFDREIALLAGDMILMTDAFGLSLGDRACLATAAYLGLEVVTADRIWGKIKGIAKINIIR